MCVYIYIYIYLCIHTRSCTLYIILLEYQVELHLIPRYRFHDFDPSAPALVCYSLALVHCNTRQELCLCKPTNLNRGQLYSLQLVSWCTEATCRDSLEYVTQARPENLNQALALGAKAEKSLPLLDLLRT